MGVFRVVCCVLFSRGVSLLILRCHSPWFRTRPSPSPKPTGRRSSLARHQHCREQPWRRCRAGPRASREGRSSPRPTRAPECPQGTRRPATSRRLELSGCPRRTSLRRRGPASKTRQRHDHPGHGSQPLPVGRQVQVDCCQRFRRPLQGHAAPLRGDCRQSRHHCWVASDGS